MPIASLMPFNHLILWCPLLLLPSIFPSTRDFSNESAVHIVWLKYWSFSFSISPSSGIQGWFSVSLTGFISLISTGLLGVFSNTTVQRHQFFGGLTPLWFSSHYPMVTTGKIIALIIWILSAEWCLCFSTHSLGLSTFPAKKQSSSDLMAAVTICSYFGAQEEELCTASTFSPSICHEILGLDAMILDI